MARRLPARLSANLCSQLGRNFLFAALLILGTACAQTSVRPIVRTEDQNLRAPARILVYDFAISEAHVIEYDGIMRRTEQQRFGYRANGCVERR
jgi:hypothetical protein